jgi:hypothetical protein
MAQESATQVTTMDSNRTQQTSGQNFGKMHLPVIRILPAAKVLLETLSYERPAGRTASRRE